MLIAKPNKMKQTGLCAMVLLTSAEDIFATFQLKLPPYPSTQPSFRFDQHVAFYK